MSGVEVIVPGAGQPRNFEKELKCVKAVLTHTEQELIHARAAIRSLRSGLAEIIEQGRTGEDAVVMADIASDTLTGGFDE